MDADVIERQEEEALTLTYLFGEGTEVTCEEGHVSVGLTLGERRMRVKFSLPSEYPHSAAALRELVLEPELEPMLMASVLELITEQLNAAAEAGSEALWQAINAALLFINDHCTSVTTLGHVDSAASSSASLVTDPNTLAAASTELPLCRSLLWIDHMNQQQKCMSLSWCLASSSS